MTVVSPVNSTLPDPGNLVLVFFLYLPGSLRFAPELNIATFKPFPFDGHNFNPVKQLNLLAALPKDKILSAIVRRSRERSCEVFLQLPEIQRRVRSDYFPDREYLFPAPEAEKGMWPVSFN
jgi:hypothetical protein